MVKIPSKLMREWYGKDGKLAKSGFIDIEKFDDNWEPEDTLAHDPASPNALPVDLDELTVSNAYDYFLAFRERARVTEDLPRWLRKNRDYQAQWLITLLYGEGERPADIAEFIGISVNAVVRRIQKLEKEFGFRK